MEETKKLPSVSERLQLLLLEAQENAVVREAGSVGSAGTDTSAWDAVIKTLEKEKVPAATAEDVNSYYTSFVPHRPYADYFDFDGGQIDVEEPVAADVSEPEQEDEDEDGDEGEDEDVDEEEEESSSNYCPETAEESVQHVLDRLNTYKNEFRELIYKLDEASLVPAQNSKPIGIAKLDQRPGTVNSIVSSILGTLQSIQSDTVSRKRSRNDYETHVDYGRTAAGIALSFSAPAHASSRVIPARVVDSSAVPNLKDVEEDPCYGLTNFGVVLIKSPTTVAQLWNEYTKLPSDWALPDWFEAVAQQHTLESGEVRSPAQLMKRRTSIRDLEKRYGSSWRNNDKNFSRQVNRRKKVWLAIEEGLEDDIPLQECFKLLESYVRERGKGLSWYYNGVPFKLIDIRGGCRDNNGSQVQLNK
ncbi:transcription activator GCR1-like domain-containing protein LALA0_S08e03884g [Lachancea lanzarotensis]|uniref:LALA0S08e03884g1_1 n=1 Tax=Lachancea lanzarotensis TaxID=1245769 RepID=A0A0C7N6H5_9SACH|nr:uncharacterized protein LALA0_S08e03884g [Lachancea lanzarotensis]CEP63500.1 LALA0S08e03884g1_1 [Lachancea lanzarotensis]